MDSFHFVRSVLIVILINIVTNAVCNGEDSEYESSLESPIINDGYNRQKRTLIFLVPFDENENGVLKRSNRPGRNKLLDRKWYRSPIIQNETRFSNTQKSTSTDDPIFLFDSNSHGEVRKNIKRYTTSRTDLNEGLFNERRPYFRMISVNDRKSILNKLSHVNSGHLRKRGNLPDSPGNRIALIVGKEVGKPPESKKTQYNCFCQAKDGNKCNKHQEINEPKDKKHRSVRVTNLIDDYDDDFEVIDVDDPDVIPLLDPAYYIQNFQIIPESKASVVLSKKKSSNPLRGKVIHVPHLFTSTQNPESSSDDPEEPTKINIPFATHVNFDQRVFLYNKKHPRYRPQQPKDKFNPKGSSKDVPVSLYTPLGRNFENLDECVKMYGFDVCEHIYNEFDERKDDNFDIDDNKHNNDYNDDKDDLPPVESPVGEVTETPWISIEEKPQSGPITHEINQQNNKNAHIDDGQSPPVSSADENPWKTPTKYYNPQNRIIDYIKNHKPDENPDNFNDPHENPNNPQDVVTTESSVDTQHPHQKLIDYFRKLKNENNTSEPPMNSKNNNGINTSKSTNSQIPKESKNGKENRSLGAENQPPNETSTLKEGAIDETSPTYLGKLVPTNPRKLLRTRDLSELEDSDLFYAGGGVKLPLTIRKLRDGSFALAVSDKACKHFLRGNCPSCLKDKDGLVRKLPNSADTIRNMKRYPKWKRSKSTIGEETSEEIIVDPSEISTEDMKSLVRIETDRNQKGNEFLLKLLNVDEIPNDAKTEVAMTAIDDMLTFTPKFQDDQYFPEDDWESKIDSDENDNGKYGDEEGKNIRENGISGKVEIAESEEEGRSNGNFGYLQDNPIFKRLRFPTDKQMKVGSQRLQRSNEDDSSKRTGALRNMLYWMKELILGPPARDVS